MVPVTGMRYTAASWAATGATDARIQARGPTSGRSSEDQLMEFIRGIYQIESGTMPGFMIAPGPVPHRRGRGRDDGNVDSFHILLSTLGIELVTSSHFHTLNSESTRP